MAAGAKRSTAAKRTTSQLRLQPNFNTPVGWENYMRDLGAALAKGTPSQEEIGEIASRYDFRGA
jgi:hypothetical protein